MHPENQKFRRHFEESDFQARKFFEDTAENHGNQWGYAIQRPAKDMHREKMGLPVNQRADITKRAWMAEKRNVELLRGLVKRKESRIVHLFVLGVAH